MYVMISSIVETSSETCEGSAFTTRANKRARCKVPAQDARHQTKKVEPVSPVKWGDSVKPSLVQSTSQWLTGI
jgi:hypothetical protein